MSKGEGGADGRVPCHGKFSSGGEDPHADIGVVVLGRKDEGGLREIHLVCDPLHGRGVEAGCVGKHCELVPAEVFVGENVVVQVAVHAWRG
ncbi:MAG: hypothetical protein ABGZ37_12785 [Akkermansiaceae bacterium]